MDNLNDLDDFKAAARTQVGSRDLGAQLFCALLRSVAVETRLVCSLQTLPFSGVTKGMTPDKPKPDYILATDIRRPTPTEYSHTPESSADFSNPRRRIGQPQFASSAAPATPPVPKKKKIIDSPFPVFWVEAFNEAAQKWIALDPIVRHTINKPKTGFEPPASDRLNSMSYVIAFEEDGRAKDVTVRYARHYNAKTRKTRVESTKGGVQWWKKTMAFFEKSWSEDRDEIEDAELAAKEVAEEMPRNVQDFKDHPYYALERHLRRNEAIFPLKEVGKVSPGMGKDAKLESIYRRKDVHTVRSADQWYRLGRDVKVGEQPLKRAIPKRRQTQLAGEMDADDEVQEGTRLYAEFQTDVYVPPPVVNGRVPKNVYGNIDVYVPTMIPAGSVHIQHPEASRAAKTLGIDFADAVTGFEFKGRQGTAVIKGVVIAAEYKDALVEVLRCFNDERARALEYARTLEALGLWKKFLVALRVKERVKEYEYEDDEDENAGSKRYEQTDDDSEDEDYVGPRDGGFIHDDDEDGGGFIPEPQAGGVQPEDAVDPHSGPDYHASQDEHLLSARANHDLVNVDLDAGIIIQESPHPINPPAETSNAPSELVQTGETEDPPDTTKFSPETQRRILTLIKESSPKQETSQPDSETSHILDNHQDKEDVSKNLPPAPPDLESSGSALADINLADNTTEVMQLDQPDEYSEIEKGSLLSEDPDEVDADPEWMT